MDIEFIENIIKQHRNGVTIEELQNILSNKTIQLPIKEIMSNSSVFSLYNGLIFLKTSLMEMKEDFFSEFQDYIKDKIDDISLRKKIHKWCEVFIPDTLFIEWINISLERKITIFDILYSLIFVPAHSRNKLKNYFSQIVNFYSTITIYLKLLSNDDNGEFENFIVTLKEVEIYENILKHQLFNILIIPDIINVKLQQWRLEFNIARRKIKHIFKKSFRNVQKYSSALFERVVRNELDEFNTLSLLSRFEFKTLLDWILFLSEEKREVKIHHSLFDDLDL